MDDLYEWFKSTSGWGQPNGGSTQYDMLAAQNAGFGQEGTNLTNESLGGYGNNYSTMQSLNGANNGGFMQSAFGQGGWAPSAIQGFGAAFNAWNAMQANKLAKQQLGLAREGFAFQKSQFANNFDAEAKLINARLEDRQRARIASDGNRGNYQSVGDYMDKNKVTRNG